MSLILERLMEDEDIFGEYDEDNFIDDLFFEEDESPVKSEVLYLDEDKIDEIFKKKPEEDEEDIVFDSLEGLMEHLNTMDLDDRGFKFELKNETESEEPKERTKESSAVNHPNHYNQTFLETMEKFLLIYADKPDYIKGAMLFNIIKYTDRAGHKDDKKQDEKKAEFYLNVLKNLFPKDVEFYNKYRNHKI